MLNIAAAWQITNSGQQDSSPKDSYTNFSPYNKMKGTLSHFSSNHEFLVSPSGNVR